MIYPPIRYIRIPMANSYVTKQVATPPQRYIRFWARLTLSLHPISRNCCDTFSQSWIRFWKKSQLGKIERLLKPDVLVRCNGYGLSGDVYPPGFGGYVPENIANKSNGNIALNSNLLYPTQSAVKSFVDSSISREKKITLNKKTASHTLTMADVSCLVEMNLAVANYLTIPVYDWVIFFPTVGTIIRIANYGTGVVTIRGASASVIIRSPEEKYRLAQWGQAELLMRANNEWYLQGDLMV